MHLDDDVPRVDADLDRPNINPPLRPQRDLSRAHLVLSGLAGAVLGAVAAVAGQAAFDTVQTDSDLKRAYAAGYDLGESGRARNDGQCSVAAAVLFPQQQGEFVVYREGCDQALDGSPPFDPDTVVEIQTG